MVQSKRDIFLATYRRHQTWSLPDSMIYYIAKNPTSSKCYQKLVQSCRHFFIQNLIIVVESSNIFCNTNKWISYCNDKKVDLNNVTTKIWMTSEHFVANDLNQPAQGGISFIPKIYQSDIKEFQIVHQNIRFNDLIFLASKCERVRLYKTNVINDDDSVVAMEKLFEALPSLKSFTDDRDHLHPNVITTNTVKELLKIPNFSNLDFFGLCNLSDDFDIDTIYAYMKKNKKTRIHIRYNINIPHACRIRLQTVVNELLTTRNRDYKLPFIHFPGMTDAALLWKLFQE